MADAVLGVDEVARRLGLSAGRVRKLLDDGRLRATKVGRTWVLREDDVSNYALKTRRAGRPLWGNWYFQDLGDDLQRWLVEECHGMQAQTMQNGPWHDVRVVFLDRQGKPYHYIHDSGYSRSLSEKWRHISQALEQWLQAVYKARPGVLVIRKWDPDRSPGTELEEIVEVEDGPQVGGPVLPPP